MSLPSFWTVVTLLAIAGYLLTWLLIPWVLLKRSVHPSASVAWIMAILFIPFVGALSCALFGVTRWERRSAKKQQASAAVNRQLPAWQQAHAVGERQLGRWAPLARLTRGLTGAEVTADNHVRMLPDTVRSAQLIKQVVQESQHWIHLEFYIWQQDRLGTELRDMLIEKARQGVEVRLLFDGVGSMLIGRHFLKPMQRAGVRTAYFTPGARLANLLTLNLRNHRKLVISDGSSAVTGGMNIGDEHIHPTKSYGHWRDTQIMVRGPAVAQLQEVFARDWAYATGEVLTAEKYYTRPGSPGRTPATVIADGPDDDVDTFYNIMVAAIGLAQHRITLGTPYFVPPEGLIIALETAARRGVHVRMMVADRGNFLWSREAGRSYYDGLLAAGVEIHEYQRGIYHPKTLTVDGQWCMVGTANCDFRSLLLNFEVGVSMFDEDLACQLDEHFENDLQDARRVDPAAWQRRSRMTRLKERFWGLFAPLL